MEGERFELHRGQVLSIGRSPTNRVVISDEVCSRNHCELFCMAGRWIVRDLGSRNGTRVEGALIDCDTELRHGHAIQLGSTTLTFERNRKADTVEGEINLTATDDERETSTESVGGHTIEPEILHRSKNTRYRTPDASQVVRDRASLELARLYRLALDMGAATDARQLSQIVLDGLFAATSADIGAILLTEGDKVTNPSQLSVTVYKSLNELPYQRVSDSLSRLAWRDGEGILARDIQTDGRLANRDSLGELSAQSVICSPVRSASKMHGLVHLYSTNFDNPLEKDDLDFVLAVAEQFAVALDNLQRRDQLQAGLSRVESENRTLREQLEQDTELIGESAPMLRLRGMIERISATDATVLIRGESGVGKELVARAVHTRSPRSNGPFITMNCAALSESLLESELFGHEKGSFTGATARKFGKFEQAHQGTIFLDEVGEMSPAVQSKFLRVLEGHPFERVGGGTQVRVNVRVVAATNRDLERSVEAGEFRKDLYFRLQVVELEIPPLRERSHDIPLLAQFFLKRFARKTGRPLKNFSPAALESLTTYQWPGNIRELQNTIERAVILSAGDVIHVPDIQLSALGNGPITATIPTAPAEPGDYQVISLDELEHRHIMATLDYTNWNKSQAAQLLGIERSTLDRKLKRYDVGRPLK